MIIFKSSVGAVQTFITKQRSTNNMLDKRGVSGTRINNVAKRLSNDYRWMYGSEFTFYILLFGGPGVA